MTDQQTHQADEKPEDQAPEQTAEQAPPELEQINEQTSPEAATDPDENTSNRANKEAAKYRRQLRDTEAERDTLRTQLDAARWQLLEPTGKDEQISGEVMRKLGHTIDEFVRDDGGLDHDAYRATARALADELGLALPMGTYVPTEGAGKRNLAPNARQSFANALARGRDDD